MEIEDEEAIGILANVRDILLPLVDASNECGSMISCTGSSMECVECLAKQVVEQYNSIKQYYEQKGK